MNSEQHDGSCDYAAAVGLTWRLHALHTTFFAKGSNTLGPRRDKFKVEGVIMSENNVIYSKIAKSDYKLRHVFLPVCLSVLPSS
jgi:hypothetical protein